MAQCYRALDNFITSKKRKQEKESTNSLSQRVELRCRDHIQLPHRTNHLARSGMKTARARARACVFAQLP